MPDQKLSDLAAAIALGGSDLFYLVQSGVDKSITATLLTSAITAGITPASIGALSASTSSTQNGYFGDIFLYDDSTPSHYLQITNSANLTAARTLSINVNDASRTISLSGNLTVSGAATISGSSSGTNTGDQTITLSGDATGSGTSGITVTIPTFAGLAKGLVPVSTGSTAQFLRGDGAWSALAPLEAPGGTTYYITGTSSTGSGPLYQLRSGSNGLRYGSTLPSVQLVVGSISTGSDHRSLEVSGTYAASGGFTSGIHTLYLSSAVSYSSTDDVANNAVNALYASVYNSSTSGNSNGANTAYFYGRVDGSGIGATGIRNEVQADGTAGGRVVYGIRNTITGAVGTAYGVYISSSASATTAYGLYVAGITGTTAYAIYTNTGIVSFGDRVDTTASTTSSAGLRIPHGAAPSSPVDGDLWSTTTSLNFQLNGATKSIAFTDTAPAAHVLDSASHTISGKTAGQVLLATAATTFAFTTISGDATINGSGSLTVANNAITLAKMATVATATFLGRTTAGTGNVEALTATQATALLNTFTTSLKGLAPASGGGTTNFLRADGTWAAPPSSGTSPSAQTVSASATITGNRVVFTGSTASQTLTLPAAASQDIWVRNSASVAVTIARAGGDTIESATTFILYPGESIILSAVSTNWTVF